MGDWYVLETMGDLNDASLAFLPVPPEGVTRHVKLMLGKRAAKDVSPEARFVVTERSRTRLAGFVGTRGGYLVCSVKAKAIIEAHTAGTKIEFARVSIVHHVDKLKPQVLSEQYFIVNPLGGCDVLDREASRILHASADGSLVVEAPVFDGPALEKAPHLFRLRHRTTTLMISDELVRALVSSGIGNFLVRPVLVNTPQLRAKRPAPSNDFVLVDAGGPRLVLPRAAAERIRSACGGTTGADAGVVLEDVAGRSGEPCAAVTAARLGAYADISGFLFRQADEAKVLGRMKVVLREDRLAGAPPFFQLTHRDHLFVMHVALHRQLVEAGMTSLVTVPLTSTK